MFRKSYVFFVIPCVLWMTGCAPITETAKVIWGSSTRALENARAEAISRTYRCSLNDCYEAVVGLARVAEEPIPVGETADEKAEPAPEVSTGGYFDIFINNRKKGLLVVMGISGNIDTTEAGIFFTQPTLTTVKVEVTSLSSSAKRKVAELVFDGLTDRFSEAP